MAQLERGGAVDIRRTRECGVDNRAGCGTRTHKALNDVAPPVSRQGRLRQISATEVEGLMARQVDMVA